MAISDKLEKLKTDITDSYNELNFDELVEVTNKNTNNLPDTISNIIQEYRNQITTETVSDGICNDSLPLNANMSIDGTLSQDITPTLDEPQEVKVLTGVINITVTGESDSKTYSVDLGDEFLAKIGTYVDKLIINDDGSLSILHNVDRVNPKGNSSEGWSIQSDSVSKWFMTNSLITTTGTYVDGYSNYFSNVKAYPTKEGTFSYRSGGSSLAVRYLKTATTLNEFTTFLSKNDVYFYYMRNTSRTVDLDNKVKINLFEGNNTITIDKDTTFSVTYFKQKVNYLWSTSGHIYLKNMVVPKGTNSLAAYCFSSCNLMETIDLPDTLTSVGQATFTGCTKLSEIIIPDSVTTLNQQAFPSSGTTHIVLGTGVTALTNSLFGGNASLKKIEIKGVITGIGWSPFYNASGLEEVTFADGLNVSIDLSVSTKFTREVLVNIINAYADRTGQDSLTFTIGSTNLAKLTEDDIAIATAKNITLA